MADSVRRTRSSSVKKVAFSGLMPTPTISSSKIALARWMMSRWPRWMGSNTPVYTARRGLKSGISGTFRHRANGLRTSDNVHQPVDLFDRVIAVWAHPQPAAADVHGDPG